MPNSCTSEPSYGQLLRTSTPKQSKSKSSRSGRRKRNTGNKSLTVAGPWGTRLSIPMSKLPFLIGSDTNLSAHDSVYPVVHGMSIPIAALVGTVASGAIANSIAVSFALIDSWSSRYGNTFDEYCITGASFEVRAVTTAGNGTGLIYAYLDEKDSALPTSAPAAGSPRLDISFNNYFAPVTHQIDWMAKDLADLSWTSTATPITPVYLKIFGNAANTFLDAAAAGQVYVTGALNVDFRGFKN